MFYPHQHTILSNYSWLQKLYGTGMLLFLLLLGTACTKNFEDINNDSTRVNRDRYKAEYSLTRAQLEYAGNSDFSYDTWRVNIVYCGMMMQHLANTSWYAGDKYMRNDSWSAAYFEMAYRDQVKYIVDMLSLTAGNSALSNLHQVGRIMNVLIFHRLTDLYGDIPYKEAGLGYLKGITNPRYDPQDSIYYHMLSELEGAATAFDETKAMPGTADLFYGSQEGSLKSWKKLAYTLMLRLGMRMVNKNETLARYWVEKAYRGGVILENAENAYVWHDAKGGRATVNRNSNILGGEWNATGWNKANNAKTEVFLSERFISTLQISNDPRLQWMAQLRDNSVTDPAAQIGMPNGYDQNGSNTDISLAPSFPGTIEKYSTIRGDIWLKLDGPTMIVSASQANFLLAEAAYRGWDVGNNVSYYYEKGIRAAMKELEKYDNRAVITDVQINHYLQENPLQQQDPLSAISEQYWLSCFLDWYECFSNWRRSGRPQLIPVNYPGNATQSHIPRRMLYPAAEAAVNAWNYSIAISRQGPNDFMTRVWWDQP